MTGKSALIIGATGQTGQHLLKELLASDYFTRVGEYGRRVTDAKDIVAGKDKLEQKVVDFEKIQPGEWKDGKWDVLFITLGTTKSQAGSAEAFERIDRDYVVNAAKAAKAEGIHQSIVYLSSTGASPTSSILYSRSKGLTEEALASLGYNDTIIFRAAFLKGAKRESGRIAETVVGFITGPLNKAVPVFEIRIPVLAKSMRLAGQLGSEGLPPAAEAVKEGRNEKFTVIGNKGAIALSKT